MNNLPWTEKHKPTNIAGVVGQAEAVKDVLEWLDEWHHGKGIMLAGQTGIGKTLLMEVISREKGHLLLQMNASDVRTPDAIESFLGAASKQRPLFHKSKIIVLDEVDGISGRDRGAAGAILKLIKESRYPVFLIANDPWNKKLSGLRAYCKVVKMKKVHMYEIMKVLKVIAGKEGIDVRGDVIRSLAKWSSGDLRSAISDLQTIAEGKAAIDEKDMEILGYRERESDIFHVLPVIFHSKNINASRKAMRESDKDADELFLWIETNLPMEFKDTEALADAYDLLSRADIFRRRVMLRQNWRFKAYMQDLIAGISLYRGETKRAGFSPYQYPDRISILGRSKMHRALRDSLLGKIGSRTHCSRAKAKDYLPYLKIIRKKHKNLADGLALEKEELKLL